MKKRVLSLPACLSLSIAALFAYTNAHADTVLGLYAGAQAWQMNTTGGFSDDGNNLDFNFSDKTKSSFYVALEHPIPLVPNVKLQRTNMDAQGDVVLSSQFVFGGELFTATTTAVTDVKLSATDVILYYELFDNDLVSFDVGINAKYLDGELFVVDKNDPTASGREEFSGVVPMLYSRLALGLPATGFGAYAEGSYLSFDDQTITDYQAGLTYSLMENLAIDLTFQLGYRAVQVELKDLDSIYSQLDFKGAFVGMDVHF
ncbi:MAG: TIGR04219 family outer membrane beta-barrel protein [Paraglaciecola sp.]|nr:TIGR04219 family outer membrane beta-barrel protein [Paraglaciecola sp.]NCT47648.1 TIGR04219 family outer membrane beta-barrel protein [Paraglaciecola sp.]